MNPVTRYRVVWKRWNGRQEFMEWTDQEFARKWYDRLVSHWKPQEASLFAFTVEGETVRLAHFRQEASA